MQCTLTSWSNPVTQSVMFLSAAAPRTTVQARTSTSAGPGPATSRTAPSTSTTTPGKRWLGVGINVIGKMVAFSGGAQRYQLAMVELS